MTVLSQSGKNACVWSLVSHANSHHLQMLSWRLRLIWMNWCWRQLGVLVSCSGKKSYLIRVWSRAISLYILCLVWMSSAESHLSLLDSIVLQCGKAVWGWTLLLGHRKKVSALCLLYEIYHRTDHSLHEYLHHFLAARNTRASAALNELALMIPRWRTDKFSRVLLPVAVRL